MFSFRSFYNADEDTLAGFIALFIACVGITKGFVTIDDIPVDTDGNIATVAGFYWNKPLLSLFNGIPSPKEGDLTYYFCFCYFF